MNKTFSKFSSLIIIGFLSILLSTGYTFAQKTWVGTTTDWNTASNWNPSGVPVSLDIVIIPTTPAGGNMPTISSGTFTTGQLTVESGATLTQTGGELTFDTGNAIIYGTFDQSGGTLLANNKDLKFENGGKLIQSGTGVIHMNTSTGLTPAKGIKFKDNGGGAATGSQEGSAIIRCKDFKLETSNCTFTQSGTGLITVGHDWKNLGTFTSTGGTVEFTGANGDAGNGASFIGTNQFFNLINDAADPGFDKVAGSTIKIAGDFTNNNSLLDVTTAEFIFNGTSDQTISSASNTDQDPILNTFGKLTIDNPGTVTLLTDVGAKISFSITQGTLDLNGNLLFVNGEEYTGPLPVELVSFSARISDTNIILDWLTATEVNNYGFEIERKIPDQVRNDNRNWENIGFVEGHGNSNSPKEYNFIDSEINSAGTYSYRLKQIDNDGTYEFSNIIEVNFGSPINFELSQNYPNPFNPSTTISFNLPESGKVILKIYNIMGEEIKTLVEGYREAGIYTVKFNAEGHPSGMYLYRLSTNGFTETKKMLFMK